MSRHKEIRDLIKRAESQGWQITRSKGDHLKWVSPSGKPLFFGSTPSDIRSLKNQVSLMRKHGFIKQ